ncbi:hypothetical protein NAC44_01205 [Allorhizobium sp. BGMRC 0089]|uniref:transglycosylase SLT domain-containing protein n=1 Tax=Allorhizobium sonneratiae TaxID=2934936 RepID=UPI0020342C3D|nr:hypothetical protein [Allorhizobium sonneratiae]MCM2290944.1 hypothetical protein [Allorhizobium sonneratiae]
MRKFLILALLLALASCAQPPRYTRNACAIFEQRDGVFDNWKRAARATSREYGVPVPVLMATIYTESGFRARARPPRRYLLGFIPWKRISTAYGYSQALDGTWDRYKRETGRLFASRTNFADSVRFIGWYHYQSHMRLGIPYSDAYHLYLAYHSGQDGYLRAAYRARPEALQGARRFAAITETYARQMQQCP